ncbi:alanine dehydrogenase [Flavobacterium sp. MAH-1]|uniref:Saccharopine dehydrogenase [NAD(+), L-lysine-forming] n=1 Tax=Flavobacterium agri TaxID=2743471 RepID=A0A7Y8Y436_9FLAO|nr:NAD(P)-dependent oxidoreductase [Flavobacterium agri]NUY82209.1 alanine dehydrogenase [Flavobacterium agri]NYA72233.1 alanine dehydrogenase [Flavobacterium agri]
MKFAIIRERKNPPDRRVVFSPDALLEFKNRFPQAEIKVESSPIRVFTDQEYRDKGFEVTEDVSDCDVFIGVKEVPVEALVPNKKYFFFSHTIKKQPHNQKLLQAILDKKIDLYDHETIVDKNHVRLIGFGRYAGIVGAYNGLRAFGLKFELFNLPKAESLHGQEEMTARVKRVTLPPIKIVLTGFGKVGKGAKHFLDSVKIKEVSPDDFLNKKYSDPVYTHIDVLDYNKRIDRKTLDKHDFYAHPEQYESDFERFSKVADIFMAGHFYGNGAPVILTREMLQKPDNNIRVVADISCDVDGPVACTLRASTIADPIYGYSASEHKEVDVFHPSAVVVMAVDNLPCELPKDASEGFGEMFLEHVVPAFFNADEQGVLERALITSDGHLTPAFAYLEDYVHPLETHKE